MGNGAGVPGNKAQRLRSDQIDAELRKDKHLEKRVVKILLLGAAECGKSTVMKQMRIIHTKGFSEDERRMQKEIIYNNVIQSMVAITSAMERLQISFHDHTNGGTSTYVHQEAGRLQESPRLSDELASAIKKLWRDDGVRKCFERSNAYQLSDSAQYFLDSIDRIVDPNFMPSDQDVLRARVTTTGIVEATFERNCIIFRICDVGGQRSERKKWFHCFDNVQAVLFVTSLSEYDQKLYEDENMNRMIESILLFETICKSPYFVKASILLFLNKKDLFEQKLKKTSLCVAFPKYDGPQKYDECVAYIDRKFRSRDHSKRKMYTHETCATDTEQIQFVIETVLDIIVAANLQDGGMA